MTRDHNQIRFILAFILVSCQRRLRRFKSEMSKIIPFKICGIAQSHWNQ